jgi:hypothetical protein
MAVMNSADRTAVSALFQSDASLVRETLTGVLRSDIQAAVNAIDDWVVANAASFNSALPLAARSNLTAAQKARLLSYVVMRRYVVGA